jgi:hypothetical protein
VAYVDDFIVAASDYSLIELLNEELSAKYEVNMAPYVDYIGVRITPQPDGSTAFSRPFQLNKLFESWRPVAPTRPALTPCTVDYVKKRPTDAPRSDQKKYMSLLGSLTQLVDVRPDLSFAVSFCAQHTHHCTDIDFQALLRIVDYLHHTRDHQLILRPGDTSMGRVFVQARGFCDAAFGLHPDGYSQLANALDLVPCDINGVSIAPENETRPTAKINVQSTKSTTVDLSSADSEISGMLKSVKDIIYTRGVLGELGFHQFFPTPLYNDNKSSITLASKLSGSNKRVRYIMPKIAFLLNEFNKGTFAPTYLSSESLPVDICTKVVTGSEFYKKQGALLGHAVDEAT